MTIISGLYFAWYKFSLSLRRALSVFPDWFRFNWALRIVSCTRALSESVFLCFFAKYFLFHLAICFCQLLFSIFAAKAATIFLLHSPPWVVLEETPFFRKLHLLFQSPLCYVPKRFRQKISFYLPLLQSKWVSVIDVWADHAI